MIIGMTTRTIESDEKLVADTVKEFAAGGTNSQLYPMLTRLGFWEASYPHVACAHSWGVTETERFCDEYQRGVLAGMLARYSKTLAESVGKALVELGIPRQDASQNLDNLLVYWLGRALDTSVEDSINGNPHPPQQIPDEHLKYFETAVECALLDLFGLEIPDATSGLIQ